MNDHTRAMRFDAKLRQLLAEFSRETANSDLLLEQYCGLVDTDSTVAWDDFDELESRYNCRLEELDQAKAESKGLRETVEKIRDALQDAKLAPYDPAAFIALIDGIVWTIQESDTDIIIDHSRITAALSSCESYLEEQAATVSEIQTPQIQTPAAATLSPTNPEPNQTKTDENQHTAPQRRLPCIGLGKRAA